MSPNPNLDPEEHHHLVSDSDDSTLAADSIDSSPSSEKISQEPPYLRQRLSRRRSPRTGRASLARRWQTRLSWLRWTIIVLLQSTIIGLLLVRSRSPSPATSPAAVAAGGDINGIYVDVPRQYRPLTFEEDVYMPDMSSNDNREEVRRNWDALMPLGSGSVVIENWKDYPLLGPPITDDPARSGALYEASWTHALHCLYYSIDTYHQLVLYGPTGNESHHHASHCFEYIRQNIMCNLDMTLEGSYSANTENGGQRHVCRNREHAVQWIESRRVDDLRDIVGP